MFTKAMLIGAAVLMSGISELPAQTVDRDTVQALRQMAIEAGQTLSSADKPPVKSQEEIEHERKAYERQRAAHFARVYGGKSYAEAKPEDIAIVLPIPAKAPEPVDRATVEALRRMAIEAGKTLSSADKPLVKSQEETEHERKAYEQQRAAHFARVYGTKPGM